MSGAEPDRLVVFHDQRTGDQFLMRVPSSSPWFALLPPVQEAEIRARSADEAADDAAYRDAGGLARTHRPA